MNFGFDDNLNKVGMFSKDESVRYLGDLSWRGFTILDALTLWKLTDNYVATVGLLNNNPVTEIGPGHTVVVLVPLPNLFNEQFSTVYEIMQQCQVMISPIKSVANKYNAGLATVWAREETIGETAKYYLAVEVKNNDSETMTIAEDVGFSVFIIQDGGTE